MTISKEHIDLFNNLSNDEFMELVNKCKHNFPKPIIETKYFDQLLEMKNELLELYIPYIQYDKIQYNFVLIFEHIWSNNKIQYYKPSTSVDPFLIKLRQLGFTEINISI
jgi:hypothetical protein